MIQSLHKLKPNTQKVLFENDQIKQQSKIRFFLYHGLASVTWGGRGIMLNCMQNRTLSFWFLFSLARRTKNTRKRSIPNQLIFQNPTSNLNMNFVDKLPKNFPIHLLQIEKNAIVFCYEI